MVKFKFTAERIAEALTVPEYISCLSGSLGGVLKILPVMAVDDEGNYVVEVVADGDGDIQERKNMKAAEKLMESITPRRLKALSTELAEALKQVVNPTSGRG